MTERTTITIKDLAARLGVSHSTVSRALSPGKGRTRMSPVTRERIVQAARDLGYRHNAVARNLVSGRTYSIGVIVRHFNDPFYSNMIQELHILLARNNYLGVFFSARTEDEFQHALDSLVSRRVEGILSVALSEEERARVRQIDVPAVYYGIGGAEDNWVGPDHYLGARLAISHLLEAGHRKIGFIGRTDADNHRYQGFREMLREHQLPCPDVWVRSPDRDRVALSVGCVLATGCEQMSRLLALDDRPTAVICHNDVIAIGAERAVIAHGLRVPQDVALVGFDALREGEYAAVPLTTVDPHLDRIVELMVEAICARAEHREPDEAPFQAKLEPTLVVRESTAGPPAASRKARP